MNDMNNNENFTPVSEDVVSGAEKLPKKKKGGKIAAVCAGIVVVAGGGGAIAYNTSDFVKNKVKLTVLSPEKYSAWVYENNSEEQADSISKAYEDYLKKYKSGMTNSFALQYTATDDAKDYLLNDILGIDADLYSDDEEVQMISDIINNIDTLESGLNASAKKGSTLETIYASLNDEQLASLEFGIDAGSLELFMRIPELAEQWLGIDMNTLLDTASMDSETEAYMDLMQEIMSDPEDYISPEELSDFIARYTAVWNENLEDVELEKKESVDIGDIEVNYTVITSEIDEEKAIEIVEAFIDEASDDKFLKELLTEKLAVCTEDEYDEVLDYYADELKETEDSGEFVEGTVEVVTYVDAKGVICGTEISTKDTGEDFECRYVVGKDNDDVAGELTASVDGEEIINAVLNGEGNDDVYSGEIEVEVYADGESLEFSVEFDDFEVVDEDKGYVNCDLTVVVPDIDPISLKLESNGKRQEISYDLNIDGTDFGKIAVIISSDDSADVSLPDSDDAYILDENFELSDYVTEEEISAFITNICEKIGLSSEYSEAIGDAAADEIYSSFRYSYGDDDYYDDYDYYYDDDYYDYDFT